MGVNITPTAAGYIRMLMLIIERSTVKSDIEWAKNELNKFDDWERPEFHYEVK